MLLLLDIGLKRSATLRMPKGTAHLSLFEGLGATALLGVWHELYPRIPRTPTPKPAADFLAAKPIPDQCCTLLCHPFIGKALK